MAALMPTPAAPPRAKRPTRNGSRRGRYAAKPTARSRLSDSETTAAAAPRPECWPVHTTGQTWAICIVAATPAMPMPQLWPASLASAATARMEAIPQTSPVGPGMASVAPAAPIATSA